MSQCLNPNCLHKNSDKDKFCQKCRSKLVLRERYRAIKVIGQGGFGKTFLAVDEDKPTKPYCVIKQFLPQAQGTDSLQKASELFKQEAMRLDELGKHQQIPELLAYFTHEDNRQYLVQQYIEGQNLEQELKQKGVFNEAKVKDLLSDILPILEFVHSKQVIHRDIKPENIIRRKSDNKLFLVDFGASKLVTPYNRSVTGTVIGSAEYVAPEQINGKAIYASDLYSLGVTCIYLLTGISPFDLFSTSEYQWVWRQYLGKNAVSNELGSILDKLIVSATSKRYSSATEVLRDLKGKSAVLTPQIPIQKSVNPVIQVSTSSPFPTLKSAKGINYRILENLLKQKQWKEADQETANIMLQIAHATEWLMYEQIDNFPCTDLRTIDRLWVHYSNDRFGFSVQKQIYQSLGGKRDNILKVWDAFGDQVGWRVNNKWIYYKNATFDLKAPQGHLPLAIVGVGYGGVIVRFLYNRPLVRGLLFSRVESCKM
jgi:serine/threonine protein kinase